MPEQSRQRDKILKLTLLTPLNLSTARSTNQRRWQEMTLYFLGQDCFPRYMEANQSREFIYSLQQREVAGEQLPIRTVACGLVRWSLQRLHAI